EPDFTRGQPSASIATRKGPRYTLNIVDVDPAHDLALLQFPNTGDLWQFAQLDYRSPPTGAWIIAMGFPDCGPQGECDLLFPSGHITGTGAAAHLLTDTAVNHGHSGGPVFSAEGKVLAIVAGGEPDVVQVNDLIPVTFAKPLIERVPADPA